MGGELLRVGSIAHETWALQIATGTDPWHPARMAAVIQVANVPQVLNPAQVGIHPAPLKQDYGQRFFPPQPR